jgi:hypothetical protein
VTLSNNAHMTISEFDALNHGCQCNFDVELGSTLQVDTDFDLTGSNPTLSLKGTSLLAVRGVLSDNDAPLVSWTSLRLLGRDKPVVSSVVPDWSIINMV